VLWRPDSTRTLEDLPTSLVEQTLTQFGQYEESGPVRDVLRGEERRFVDLLTRGRKVLAQLGPGRPLTEADLRYLHQTHGLPPELVTELLDKRTQRHRHPPTRSPTPSPPVSLSEGNDISGSQRRQAGRRNKATPDLAEREGVGLDAGVEECDLEGVLGDLFGLADELVQPLSGGSAVALAVKVGPMRRSRRLTV
jgi:hypothetical protein